MSALLTLCSLSLSLQPSLRLERLGRWGRLEHEGEENCGRTNPNCLIRLVSSGRKHPPCDGACGLPPLQVRAQTRTFGPIPGPEVLAAPPLMKKPQPFQYASPNNVAAPINNDSWLVTNTTYHAPKLNSIQLIAFGSSRCFVNKPWSSTAGHWPYPYQSAVAAFSCNFAICALRVCGAGRGALGPSARHGDRGRHEVRGSAQKSFETRAVLFR